MEDDGIGQGHRLQPKQQPELPPMLRSVAELLGRELSYFEAIEALRCILKAYGMGLRQVKDFQNFELSPDTLKYARRLDSLSHQITCEIVRIPKLEDKKRCLKRILEQERLWREELLQKPDETLNDPSREELDKLLETLVTNKLVRPALEAMATSEVGKSVPPKAIRSRRKVPHDPEAVFKSLVAGRAGKGKREDLGYY